MALALPAAIRCLVGLERHNSALGTSGRARTPEWVTRIGGVPRDSGAATRSQPCLDTPRHFWASSGGSSTDCHLLAARYRPAVGALRKCPAGSMSHDYPLFDRLCDAVLDSVIAELFGMYLYHMRCWWKVARRMYQHTAIQPLTGNPISWAVSGPGSLEVSVRVLGLNEADAAPQNTVETLLSLLRDIPAMVARVDEVTSSMLQCPDEVSVDTIIGKTKVKILVWRSF